MERTSIGRKKSTLFEKFYTPPDLAFRLVKSLHNRINLNKFDAIVDCCCGTGSFVDAVDQVVGEHANVIACDMKLTKKGKGNKTEKDFLKAAPNPKLNPETTLVLSNVPFGINGKTAAKFIQKAAQFADHIAFLLPISFLKDSFLKRHVPSDLHVVYSKPLRNCKFLDKNDETADCTCDCSLCKNRREKYVTVNCAFIYFERRDHPRTHKRRETASCNPFFKLLDKSVIKNRKDADIRIRGSGTNAGKCFEHGDADFFIDSDRSDDYFIKLSREVKSYRAKICNEINKRRFVFLNTVPNIKYLSKIQVVRALNLITNLVRLPK